MKAAMAARPARAPNEAEKELAAPVYLGIGGRVELRTNVNTTIRKKEVATLRRVPGRNDTGASANRTPRAANNSDD